MARYIDADKIDYKIIMAGMDENAGFRAVALESDINDMPAADVVPKSEIAREVFEEIEKIIRKHDERPKYKLMIDLAILKKKYTGE